MRNYVRVSNTFLGVNYYDENNKLHRTDGPAYVGKSGHKEWYVDDKLHRTDGPAVEYADGSKEWWVNGVHLTKDEFEAKYANKDSNPTHTEVELVQVQTYTVTVATKIKYKGRVYVLEKEGC